MAEIDTSMYPKLPQAQPFNPLQQIIQAGQVQQSLGQLEVGKAMQQALQPDGSVDQNVLSSLLKKTPAGASQAIPTLDALQRLRSAGFAQEQAGLETFSKRMAITHNLFSYLASKPNPTMQDVYEIAARALDPQLDAKRYGITMPVIMNAIQSFRNPNGTPMSAAQIKQRALEIVSQASNTQEAIANNTQTYTLEQTGGGFKFVPRGSRLAPTEEGFIPGTLPSTATEATTGGQRYIGQPDTGAPPVVRGGSSPQAQPHAPTPAPRPAAAPAVSSGPPGATPAPQPGSNAPITPTPVPTQGVPGPAPGVRAPGAPVMQSLAPGVPDAMRLRSEALTTAANRVTEAANTSPQRTAQLLNLKNFLSDFKSGVGADWARKFQNFAIRNVPMPSSWQQEGAWFDKKALASQEEFAKTAQLLMQQQFATLGGTGTDRQLQSAIEASPNELLSNYGNTGIINMLLGTEDAIQAKDKAQQEWIRKNGPTRLDEFQIDFNGRFDPRVFMLNRMSPADRTAYLKRVDPADLEQLVENIRQAKKPIKDGGFGLLFSVPSKTSPRE